MSGIVHNIIHNIVILMNRLYGGIITIVDIGIIYTKKEHIFLCLNICVIFI